MRKKTTPRRLALQRTEIKLLDQGELRDVAGGGNTDGNCDKGHNGPGQNDGVCLTRNCCA